MNQADEEFVARLHDLCRQYDKENGRYQENKYEGWALFIDVVHRITGEQMSYDAPGGWVEED